MLTCDSLSGMRFGSGSVLTGRERQTRTDYEHEVRLASGETRWMGLSAIHREDAAAAKTILRASLDAAKSRIAAVRP